MVSTILTWHNVRRLLIINSKFLLDISKDWKDELHSLLILISSMFSFFKSNTILCRVIMFIKAKSIGITEKKEKTRSAFFRSSQHISHAYVKYNSSSSS